jgi:hypothetical protein
MKAPTLRLTLFVLTALSACSSSGSKKEVDARMAREDADSSAELNAETKRLIESNPNLTPEQRTKLTTLRKQTLTEVQRLEEESIKLRALLIKDIVSANYDEDQVKEIKSRIRDVEGDRISTVFNAVERANIIMGREASGNPEVMESFFWMREGNSSRQLAQ